MEVFQDKHSMLLAAILLALVLSCVRAWVRYQSVVWPKWRRRRWIIIELVLFTIYTFFFMGVIFW